MKHEVKNDTYESDVISLEYWQQPTRVHVIKYEIAAREVYQKLRRIIDNMNRHLHYGSIDDTVSYTFYGMEIYTPYDALDSRYVEALCEAMSNILDKFDNNSILDEVHRVFFDLMYYKEYFLKRYLDTRP
mgnify:CR=1 FL=1